MIDNKNLALFRHTLEYVDICTKLEHIYEYRTRAVLMLHIQISYSRKKLFWRFNTHVFDCFGISMKRLYQSAHTHRKDALNAKMQKKFKCQNVILTGLFCNFFVKINIGESIDGIGKHFWNLVRGKSSI